MKGTLPKQDVERYFELVAGRKISDAEKELAQLKGRLETGSEWVRGYVKALEGLLLTWKGDNDRYLYMRRVESEKSSFKPALKRFLMHASNRLHGEYDRGYFKALVDYIRTVQKLRTLPKGGDTVMLPIP